MTAILKVKDGNGNVIPIQAIKGEKGDKGDKGDRGLPGSGGVPDGGTTGQVLTKNSDADGDAGWKDVGGSSEWNLVLDTVINDNQIWQPLTLDRSTGVMTFDKEIPSKDVLRPAGVVPNFSANDSSVYAWKYIPNEFIAYGFLGEDGVYNSKTTIAETNVNQNVDVTKFHFEVISSVAHAWDGLNCDKIKFQLLAPNMKIWAYNASIVFRIKLTDGTNIEFASTTDTVANHMGLYTINAEAEIKDGILWINVHEQRYTLSERKNANVNGTWKNVFHTENNGYRVSENVKIAGITSTSRANQQSGMYNGTVVRIWEG